MTQVADATGVLLDTKLHAPDPRPGVVSRPGLMAALGRPGTRLTLVDAPAGWGKTTLLGQWRAQDPLERPFAWVSLDPADADPVRFWSYVIEALCRTVPDLDGDDELQAALRVPGLDPQALALPELINRLSRLRGPQTVLVLDDYHMVGNPEIDADLGFLVEHLPPALHVAVATRVDPALPLARLRARGEMSEIRMAQLRFRSDEAVALLESEVPELAPADAERLFERTEGWAAGLYLAALSLRGRRDVTGFVDEFAGDHRMVVDYLGSEVLRELPERPRRFLLQTALLERLSGPLCEAVTGEPDAALVLQELERTNTFVIPLDDRRGWYRYHHLFGELLRHELAAGEPADAVRELHRRAGNWFADNGFEDEAVEHLLASGDMQAVADVVVATWRTCANDGRLATVERWLDRMPRAFVRSDVRLCLARVWIELSLGRASRADEWIRNAAEAAAAGSDTVEGFPHVQAAIATARAIERELVGDSVTAALSARSLDLAIFPDDSPWRSVAGMAIGMSELGEGRMEEARRIFGDAADIALEHHMMIPALVCIGYLANIAVFMGELDEAERRAREALEIAEQERHGEFPHGSSLHIALARVAMARGQVERAGAEADRALELVRRGSAPGESAFIEVSAAQVRIAEGRLDEARRLLETAERTFAAFPAISAKSQGELEGTRALLAEAEAAGGTPAALGDGAAASELSRREQEVLRRLASQMSLREIADAFYVSHNTIKTQVRSIYRKLGVATREDAVSRARAEGIIR